MLSLCYEYLACSKELAVAIAFSSNLFHSFTGQLINFSLKTFERKNNLIAPLKIENCYFS